MKTSGIVPCGAAPLRCWSPLTAVGEPDSARSARPSPTFAPFQRRPRSTRAAATASGDDRAAEPVHGAQPEQQHPQRHLDDRRLPAHGPARATSLVATSDAQAAGALRLARLRHARAASSRVCPSLGRRRRRRGSSTRRRWRSIATYTCPTAPDPPGTQDVPELHRRRLLLPRRQGPHLGADQDRATSSCSPSRDDGSTLVKLERDYDLTGGARRRDRADHLGAAGLLGPHLVRLEEERQGRHARPEDRQRSRSMHARRGDRELVRGRPATASTSSPTSGCTASSAGTDGKPRIVWKASYPNSGIVKPSQVDAGSGTTPTIMNGGYVAITDNADPMNVVVYRTADAS